MEAGPGWVLNDDYSADSNGVPVFIWNNLGWGPRDIIAGAALVSDLVSDWARAEVRTREERDLARRFLGQQNLGG